MLAAKGNECRLALVRGVIELAGDFLASTDAWKPRYTDVALSPPAEIIRRAASWMRSRQSLKYILTDLECLKQDSKHEPLGMQKLYRSGNYVSFSTELSEIHRSTESAICEMCLICCKEGKMTAWNCSGHGE